MIISLDNIVEVIITGPFIRVGMHIHAHTIVDLGGNNPYFASGGHLPNKPLQGQSYFKLPL